MTADKTSLSHCAMTEDLAARTLLRSFFMSRKCSVSETMLDRSPPASSNTVFIKRYIARVCWSALADSLGWQLRKISVAIGPLMQRLIRVQALVLISSVKTFFSEDVTAWVVLWEDIVDSLWLSLALFGYGRRNPSRGYAARKVWSNTSNRQLAVVHWLQ